MFRSHRRSGTGLNVPVAVFYSAGTPRARHAYRSCVTMSHKTDPQNGQLVLALNICNLLYDLGSSTYGEITPELEFWTEYVLDE